MKYSSYEFSKVGNFSAPSDTIFVVLCEEFRCDSIEYFGHIDFIVSKKDFTNDDGKFSLSFILRFGALFSSEKTGIIYNNQIADSFTVSSPWRKFSWSEENAPRPGARPLSSMVPVIITDENGDVRMVIGGSGGSRITLSVAWVYLFL